MGLKDLTEKQIINGGNQSLGTVSIFDNANLPAANDYLYLTEGDTAATDGVYNAGQFLFTFYGMPVDSF